MYYDNGLRAYLDGSSVVVNHVDKEVSVKGDIFFLVAVCGMRCRLAPTALYTSFLPLFLFLSLSLSLPSSSLSLPFPHCLGASDLCSLSSLIMPLNTPCASYNGIGKNSVARKSMDLRLKTTTISRVHLGNTCLCRPLFASLSLSLSVGRYIGPVNHRYWSAGL